MVLKVTDGKEGMINNINLIQLSEEMLYKLVGVIFKKYNSLVQRESFLLRSV